MAQIKTYAAACKATKKDPKALPDVSMLPEKLGKSLIALTKLYVIIEAYNDSVPLDYTDQTKPKYEPIYFLGSGSGLSCDGFGRWSARSRVGPLLSFHRSADVKHFVTHHKRIIMDYFMMN